ncbi:hypothetical protein RJT34_24349 [Clitoria ternatea]|uniref:Uncharacterized protein n=1 Tax=Clitoria ternatea TaxID=43366 RepID=A0AAN9FQM4_CLITE
MQNLVIIGKGFGIGIEIGRIIGTIMSSLGTSKGILEIAKFGVYVSVPILLMYAFANNSDNLRKFMGNKSYVEYPRETDRPPSPEELREKARELARKRNNHLHSQIRFSFLRRLMSPSRPVAARVSVLGFELQPPASASLFRCLSFSFWPSAF